MRTLLMVFGDRIKRKEKREQVPLNDDPDAEPDTKYWADLNKFEVEHPMPGPAPDQYTLLDEEARPDGDPR